MAPQLGASFSTSEAIGPIRSALAIDKLDSFLKTSLDASLINVHQFSHGQSNPTYLLSVKKQGATESKWVLRKKPAGLILKSAHAIEREYALYQVLHLTNVPVPKPIHLCEN